MQKTVKLQKAGTNTTISLPKDFAEKLNIKKGDTLLLELKENGEIIIIK